MVTSSSNGAVVQTFDIVMPCLRVRNLIKILMLQEMFIYSLRTFQSANQMHCSKHSMAALQPGLS